MSRCLSALMLLCLVSPVRAETLTLVGSPWAPFMEQSLPGDGLAVQIVTEALTRAGYETTFLVARWERVLEGAGLGLNGVIVAAWRTDERAEQLAFSQPYLQNVIRAVKRRESDFTFPELLDGRLKDLPMGVVRDYAYGEALEPFANHPRYTENTLPQVLIALTHGRIAFTIGDEIALRYHIRTYFSAEADAFEFSRPLALRGLRMAVSRSNPHHERIITEFDAAIADMRADGTVERLSAPYAGRDQPAD